MCSSVAVYISLYSPKQEEFTCKLMLKNCSVPENNVLKCSGICHAVPFHGIMITYLH